MWNDIKIVESSDKNVLKYVFEKHNAVAESVLYKYPTYEELLRIRGKEILQPVLDIFLVKENSLLGSLTQLDRTIAAGVAGSYGQLHYAQKWFREHQDLTKPSVGRGLPIVHTPKETFSTTQ